MKNLPVLIACLFFGAQLCAQQAEPPSASPPRLVDFTATPEGNGYRFNAISPPLQQIAGAPDAFWTYYWEFGDGSFSFADNPVHVYAREGNFNPILEATAHYDDGPPPKGIVAGVLVDRVGSQSGGLSTVFDSTKIPIKMRASRQARANEEMVCILSYRNLGTVRTDGRLHFFFNERRFTASLFALDSARLHFNEVADDAVSQMLPLDAMPANGWALLNLPSNTSGELLSDFEMTSQFGGVTSKSFPPPTILENLLNTARGAYREEKIWRFADLQPGEKRNMFIVLHSTDKMLQDTNAFIHVEAVFAPFDPMVAPERFELEFEIVSSHDPNAIIVSDSRVNYRFIGSKKLNYKVHFQNNGEGPASTVELKVEIPEGLDKKQMKPMDWYPQCPICPKPLTNKSCLDTASNKEGLLFTFRNIYLPGSRQKGVNDRDSTKGFVRYKIEAERGMPKRSFRSRAKITFDKNAPIYTNYTRTRFKTGISPGLKVGYGFEPNFDSANTTGEGDNQSFVKDGYVFLGASLSPFKSWRVYPQIELLTGIKGREETVSMSSIADTVHIDQPPPGGIFDLITLDSVMEETSTGFVTLELPLMLRKNFSRFFGAGIGASARVQFNNGEIRVKNREIISRAFQGMPPVVLSDTTTFSTTLISSKPVRYTAFADLTFGSVRKGLNFGIRAGAILGRNRKARPFAQVSLELKL